MGKRALIFPGFGSQYAGMGRELCEASSVARAVFKQADTIFDVGDFSLSHMMFHGSIHDVSHPAVLQPALTTLGVAYTRALEARIPDFWQSTPIVTGHSFGFNTAVCASGIMSLPQAAPMFRLGADVITSNDGIKAGGMLIVLGASSEALEEFISANALNCVIANDNGGGQFVLSGLKTELLNFAAAAKVAGKRWKAMPLNDGVPAHSALMNPVAAAVRGYVESLDLSPARPEVQLINCVAQNMDHPAQIKAALIDSLVAPVQWPKCVLAITGQGITKVVECGSDIAGKMSVRVMPLRAVALKSSACIENYAATL